MKFKLKKDDLSGNTLGVIRTENSLGVTDNCYIPFDTDNIDYQDYLKWLNGEDPYTEKGTPEAAD